MIYSFADAVVARNGDRFGNKHSRRRKRITQRVCHTVVGAYHRLRHGKLVHEIAFCQLLSRIIPERAEKYLVFVKWYPVLFKSPFTARQSSVRKNIILGTRQNIYIRKFVN